MSLFKNKKRIDSFWNYRIKEKIYEMDDKTKENYITSMKNIFGDKYEPNLEPDIFYEIIEVYYDEKGKIIAWSEDSIAPWRRI